MIKQSTAQHFDDSEIPEYRANNLSGAWALYMNLLEATCNYSLALNNKQMHNG